ncbi:Hint domain-containing protein [Acetobacter malorum]|uniref:Hedgehog/Intein (Hint) domain-containing protein n=1 Tax=Acetobacter malorum TaxID=178901 RepID=A0A1Y3G7G5_9PROT|nr:Hint domain-containing protein [Acetobacter malorum]OUJ06830.1 hypothetical protein HK23_12675 [Acetobacter malorum]
MSYVSGGILYVDGVNGGVYDAGVPGNFYGTPQSGVVVLSGGHLAGSGTISSGKMVVNSGGSVDENITVSSGGSLEFENGSIIGYSSATLTLLSGGTLIVDAGSQRYTGANYILSGGTISTYKGPGTITWTSAGGNLVVESGAVLQSQNPVSGPSTIIVKSGGELSSATLQSGNALAVSGGSVADITVNSGATETVFSGGVASRQTIQPGGSVVVDSGGALIQKGANGSGNLANSGSIVVSNGGVISGGATVGGGVTTVLNGGTAKDVVAGNAGSVGTVVFSSGAILQGTTVARSGGTVSGGDLASGASLQVQSGGMASGTVVDNGGVIDVQAGGQTYYTTAGSGGVINVDSGGSTWYTVVDGGTLNLSGGGTGTNDAFVTNSTTFTSNGGTVNLQSGYSENRTWNVPASVNLNVTSGAAITNAVISSGGVVNVASQGAISGTVTVQNGGSATIWNNAGGTIDLQSDDNAGLTVSGLASGGTLTTVITGFSGVGPGNSDSIDLAGVSAAGASYAYPSDDQVVITLASGANITLNIAGVKNTGFVLVDDGHGGANAEVCFLADSLISTPSGTVAVQDIQIGDKILSYTNGVVAEQTVVWTGHKKTTVRSGLSDDMAGYPVRILKDAVADGVPFKDMLITPEHCLFFDGRFVPARMLVNGISIFYDRSITAYDYYHVETHHHAVICADGMLTESYLDTGNRKTFRQEGLVVALRNTGSTWEDDAAAPLCVERSFVEPLFRNLELRSQEIFGAPVCEETVATTSDPDVRLVTEAGAVVRPLRQDGGVYSFMLPPGTAQVRIVSRTNRPVDVIGPFVDDRRELGVAVGEINLVFASGKQNIVAHLRTEKPEGWYATDANNAAVWTNGNAVLPLEEATKNPMGILVLTLCAAGPYLLTDHDEKEISLVG